jgi:hypothetical protein
MDAISMFGNIIFRDVIISTLIVITVTFLKNMNQHKVKKLSSYFTERWRERRSRFNVSLLHLVKLLPFHREIQVQWSLLKQADIAGCSSKSQG